MVDVSVVLLILKGQFLLWNLIHYYFFFRLKFSLFLVVQGLCCCSWASSSCGCKLGLLFVVAHGFSLQWLFLLRSTGSRRIGSSNCSTKAQQLWRVGLVALPHVESFQTRDHTRVPCIGHQGRMVPGVLLKCFSWAYT